MAGRIAGKRGVARLNRPGPNGGPGFFRKSGTGSRNKWSLWLTGSTNSPRDEVVALHPFALAQLAQCNTKHPYPSNERVLA